MATPLTSRHHARMIAPGAGSGKGAVRGWGCARGRQPGRRRARGRLLEGRAHPGEACVAGAPPTKALSQKGEAGEPHLAGPRAPRPPETHNGGSGDGNDMATPDDDLTTT